MRGRTRKRALSLGLAVMLALAAGCGQTLPNEPEESAEPTVSASAEPRSWEEEKALLNELKDLVLEQEGLFNLCRGEDGVITVDPREEDLQIELDMERVVELMDELELYMVYVRPEEEYFSFKEPVELKIPWPHSSKDLCYSSTVVPEYPWVDYKEWTDLGDGWYSWYIEQI